MVNSFLLIIYMFKHEQINKDLDKQRAR